MKVKDDGPDGLSIGLMFFLVLFVGGCILSEIGQSGGGMSTTAANTSITALNFSVVIFPFAIATQIGGIFMLIGVFGLILATVNYEFFKLIAGVIENLVSILGISFDYFKWGMAGSGGLLAVVLLNDLSKSVAGQLGGGIVLFVLALGVGYVIICVFGFFVKLVFTWFESRLSTNFRRYKKEVNR